jgi:hypothetical protein
MRKLTLALLLLITAYGAATAQSMRLQRSLQWEAAPQTITDGEQLIDYWSFDGAVAGSRFPGLPYFVHRFRVDGPGKLQVEVRNATYEPFDWENPTPAGPLGEQLQFETSIARQRSGYYGKLAFSPIVERAGQYERLTSFELRITRIPGNRPEATFRGPTNTTTSVLADGAIYKVAIAASGIHKLSYNFLKNDLGMDIDNIAPEQIKVYGNTGGPLPYYTEAPREDDLVQNRIWIQGGEDGSFDEGDFLYFYAEGADAWEYREDQAAFYLRKNIYATRNYYFIKVSAENGQRVDSRASLPQGAYTSSSFDGYDRLEEEKVNVLHEWNQAQGSGKHWRGDRFDVVREYDYPEAFDMPNLIESEPAKISGQFLGRARSSSRFFVDIGGQTLESLPAASVSSINSGSDNIRPYADSTKIESSVLLSGITGDKIGFTVRYPHPQGPGDNSEGWVDWVQINARRALRMAGNQMDFRDLRTRDYPSATYELGDAPPNLRIWDITDPLRPVQQEANRNGNTLIFSVEAPTEADFREFVAFNPDAPLLQPEAIGAIPNQNLHALQAVDMLIVYPPELEQQAERLAEHRAAHNGITVEAVEIGLIYNEFASGRQEPTAVRDFSRMLYDRHDGFNYLLLFGDGSFDNRDLYGLGGNMIPTFQEEHFRLNPVRTYPSDDYYGILYGFASDPLRGELNISLGRLPVKSPEEAAEVVDKIIHYDTAPATLRDWRNRLVFVGDDNDGAGDIDHYKDANGIAVDVEEANPAFNLSKIYLDAYPQESTPGGERIPQATEQLNQSIFKGALAITYLGHGGPKGWAQERVLNISNIFSWENLDNLPVFITATCTFAGYDDPTFVTAGEEVLLNPRGGAIGLMTTVRAVYASANEELTRKAVELLFSKDDQGRPRTLGDAFRAGKNALTSNFDIDNSRKFALLADPATPLAMPIYNVSTTAINEAPASTGSPDTLRALQEVTISGEVTDQSGQRIEDFNGIIYPTIFDKRQQVSTLGQGANDTYRYEIQNNIIFKGRASVSNGRFEFSFVVPKDINYELGYGKISYYAADEAQMVDAADSYNEILIGGTDPNAISDSQGPQVEVYMNTEDFVFGSVVDATPTLLVQLSDDNGINVVGNSIGHDLEGILNDDTQNTYLLNDFYESALDDYTAGEVRYPLEELPEGRHRFRVKAWDVANNSSEGYTEFVVASTEEVALQQVLNYPNPFTDRTCFQFDHNLANQQIEVMVQIYTVSGRLVKTLRAQMFSDGALRQDDCIEWDGRDDFGDQLARGVYLYKVKVRAANTSGTARSGESDFEKLVILK